ncbi:MAG TPA: tetratricopeptide repeat protein [Pseudomonas sp.]|nr:tetratricopeptide repeat protein [Pseudomonas sp.]
MTNTSSRKARWLSEKPDQRSKNCLFRDDFLVLPDGNLVKDIRLAGGDLDSYCLERFGKDYSEILECSRHKLERRTESAVELLGRVVSCIKLGEPAALYQEALVEIERDLLAIAQQDFADAKMQLGLLYCSMGKHFGHAESDGLNWMLQALRSGHSDAPSEVGNYYLRKGQSAKAASYFRKGDKLGCAACAFRLAEMHHQGAEGIEQNLSKAFKMYEQASRRGYPEATAQMVELFLCSEPPFQLPDSPDALLREAIAEGNTTAMFCLADMYENGLHVQIDLNEAITLYKHAAQCGCPVAQLKMGNIYETGHHDGFPVQNDAALATQWYEVAANNPENPEVRKRAYLSLGHLAMNAENFEQSRHYYERAEAFGSVTANRHAAKAAFLRDLEQIVKGGN